ncbi:MAG: hypothetical protein PF484_00270 [Bacteroidales bacterium]|jgi:hypothetical protein|nr:hypothetical protein [Bacteroidales bacterium]
MIIEANTFDSDTDFKCNVTDFGTEKDIFTSNILFLTENMTKIHDVFVVYSSENFEADFSNNDLTKLSLALSESSFSELWENEDDEYWDSY